MCDFEVSTIPLTPLRFACGLQASGTGARAEHSSPFWRQIWIMNEWKANHVPQFPQISDFIKYSLRLIFKNFNSSSRIHFYSSSRIHFDSSSRIHFDWSSNSLRLTEWQRSRRRGARKQGREETKRSTVPRRATHRSLISSQGRTYVVATNSNVLLLPAKCSSSVPTSRRTR